MKPKLETAETGLEDLPALPHTIKLRSPLKWGESAPITEVVLDHEPTAADLEDVVNAKTKGASIIRLVASALDWSDPQVRALSAYDLLMISGVVQRFLPPGQEIGE